MTIDGAKDIERFRSLIVARLGLFFDDSKLGFLAEVIRRRQHETRLKADDYLRLVAFDPSDSELPALAKELTVAETYFFRNFDQFRVFREVLIPEWRAKTMGGKLTVVSAGCASGEEPYSLAMMMLEAGFEPGVTMDVRGIDINPAVIKKARRGRYSSWAFRETPPDQQKRWFHPDGRDLMLDDAVRKAVTFAEANLAEENRDLWRPQSIHAIFCRNVLMYFSPEQARKTIARMTRALVPGGFLFLGHAETLRGWSEDFHLRHTHHAFYYQVKDRNETAQEPTAFEPSTISFNDAAPPLSEDWIETIHHASERVQTLSTNGRAARAKTFAATASRTPRNTPDMAPVFALMHGDRFGEALAYVRETMKDGDRDPDVLLVEAMLLAHGGKTEEAESVCRRLLQIDEMNASAHHILALCREVAGDVEGAMEQDRIAAYLDPTFAMPRLHMGLMGRRRGDKDLGRRELGQALPLLKHEDGARLLLFGGGFNRQSMVELCASALRDCGGMA